MKKLLLPFLLLFTFSCEKTTKEVHLVIYNDTRETIDVQVFPTLSYSDLSKGSYYYFSEAKSGKLETSFSLSAGQERTLFYSHDELSRPSVLFSKVFQRVEVVASTGSFKFFWSKDGAEGYKTNPYATDDIWSKELTHVDRSTQPKRNPADVTRYIVVVEESGLAKD